MIRVSDVKKLYHKRLVLNSISLNLESGKSSILLGQSGCGKSTLLRLIIGLEALDSGSIQLEGQPLHSYSRKQLAHLIGYVTQKPSLFPHLTAMENMRLVGRVQKWSASQLEDRLRELCPLCRVPETLLVKYPAELSGGQLQRLNLLRALILNPPYLLLDEPLSALDPINRSSLQRDLREIFQSLKKTVVFVTHDLKEAAFLGDRIFLMREGQIEQEGSFDEIKERPQSDFVKEFVNAQSL